ncbi:conserved membrane protein of unknown function [Tenacibaculum sp. 190524A02b]|uniref:Beta-carotene 15,15'-monooxygenase n=1 Tax=Tenacibaculum vairaonense TaxID=3137860 RepID=A0ABM9PNM0_9FLAO
MDALDKYKKAWDNQPEETEKVSKVDIYKMTRSKSSSIVKWIFIIGILELLFWGGLNMVFVGSSYTDLYDELHLNTLVYTSIYLHYFIIVVFLVAFYKNYKSISVSDSTKTLIKKILNTRKVVKYYVYFNLFYAILANLIIVLFIFNDLDGLINYYNTHGIVAPSSKNQLIVSLIIAVVLVLSLMFVILWLFYKVIYGSLLKKLHINYQKLTKLEQSNT